MTNRLYLIRPLHLSGKWRSLRRGSAAARLLGLRVRILPMTWISVSCEFRMLSSGGLCVGLINRPTDLNTV